MTHVVGIDVGGSKIAAGLVDPGAGTVLRELRRPTPRGDAGRTLGVAVDLAAELAPDGASVGIGICELVDPQGTVTSSVTIDWLGLDVPSAFARVGPVTLESDVRAAARAEARFGAGRELADFLYLSVGTGVSCSHVVAGKPRAGARGNAVIVGAPPIEHVASGRALELRAGAARAEDVLADPGRRALVADVARSLGLGVAALVNALDPGAVVIGGGLGLDEDFRALVVAATRPAIEAETTRMLPIVPARLGSRAGVVGAALAAVTGG